MTYKEKKKAESFLDPALISLDVDTWMMLAINDLSFSYEVNGPISNLLGWSTTIAMTIAAGALLISLGLGVLGATGRT